MKAAMILKAMADDGAFVELGAAVLPLLAAVVMMIAYLIG